MSVILIVEGGIISRRLYLCTTVKNDPLKGHATVLIDIYTGLALTPCKLIQNYLDALNGCKETWWETALNPTFVYVTTL